MTTAGAVNEYPVPAAISGGPLIGRRLIDIAPGPDGALWFTDPGTGEIGRITTIGMVTQFAVPNRLSQPSMITAGPDGALWFNEADANKIGRITTSGVTTEYSLGSNGRRNTLKEKLR